jgi:hypothetical protein
VPSSHHDQRVTRSRAHPEKLTILRRGQTGKRGLCTLFGDSRTCSGLRSASRSAVENQPRTSAPEHLIEDASVQNRISREWMVLVAMYGAKFAPPECPAVSTSWLRLCWPCSRSLESRGCLNVVGNAVRVTVNQATRVPG